MKTRFLLAIELGQRRKIKRYARTLGVYFRDIYGNTPLHWAMYFRNFDALYLFLRMGADKYAVNYSGQSLDDIFRDHKICGRIDCEEHKEN